MNEPLQGPAGSRGYSPSAMGRDTADYFRGLQDRICAALEHEEAGEARFRADAWERPGGGGGVARVLHEGQVFEKAGVNRSTVFGQLSEAAARSLSTAPQGFFAAGISVIVHPRNPMVPTVHANYRYFELSDGTAWFGGGSDLTPFYLYEEDIRAFHAVLKQVCDRYNERWYREFKEWCDRYFFLGHRQEHRGAGGIFFDRLRDDLDRDFRFVCDAGSAFPESYVPIVQRRKGEAWGERERHWQLVRRGRYVEFNLLYDRGTAFGLATEGRMESVLVSLPPLVRWEYDVHPEPGSREDAVIDVVRTPRSWT